MYPSFDITPPHLVSAVVTHRGVCSPYNLAEYYEKEVEQYLFELKIKRKRDLDEQISRTFSYVCGQWNGFLYKRFWNLS